MGKHKSKVYFDDDDGTPTAQEHRIAARTGGKRQPGSGACRHAKGDVKADRFLIECKKTIHASLSVKKAWLDKISKEANAEKKWPALSIEIQGGPDEPLGYRDWVCVPVRIFEKMIRLLEEDNG